ncbi:Uu.00g107590.m01.CDS01 [Anthostomella pinea]|uniref:Uu.00g107590.m01.CDS01 n=1 Tax=Anthostomella pinea TaxID=933095 RepID=A0AAI8V986_9PEZI|nr:Uu.00g107590.m01.CDS01 [Anthostomella pinea]
MSPIWNVAALTGPPNQAKKQQIMSHIAGKALLPTDVKMPAGMQVMAGQNSMIANGITGCPEPNPIETPEGAKKRDGDQATGNGRRLGEPSANLVIVVTGRMLPAMKGAVQGIETKPVLDQGIKAMHQSDLTRSSPLLLPHLQCPCGRQAAARWIGRSNPSGRKLWSLSNCYKR